MCVCGRRGWGGKLRHPPRCCCGFTPTPPYSTCRTHFDDAMNVQKQLVLTRVSLRPRSPGSPGRTPPPSLSLFDSRLTGPHTRSDGGPGGEETKKTVSSTASFHIKTQHLRQLPDGVCRFCKAARVAVSNTSQIPSLVLAEHSK